ncbi:MAG: patatin-like phospholipase family protein [Gammaproteobacteria bacterium]|nr:patatin-like phospholipase family protein [Gammaproteobacteria bacterium]MDH4314503.1 patatin-like phospholipase family protein [Gammaproteobacteria bacterium]MDH5215377.1 patatin-like phospholipase family protein [Gammaproteobacteria bacterium]
MQKAALLFCAGLVFLLATTLHAREAEHRPKIGLALSGGGTKAGAHIGVLRVLEENHVPIDYIAGTSAGAIIGSLYAAGLTLDEIEAAIAGIDWEDMLQDAPPRRDLPFRRKRDDFSYLVKYRPGYNNGSIELPMGLIQGQKVTQFFRRYLQPHSVSQDFDALPIPLRVVATDLVSGQAVVIGSGDLPLAVRASMSIPVLFAPVEIDGRRLIDGGPSNNLPIDVVRQMGADIVIAVDITAPLLAENGLDSVLAVADQMTNILTQRTVQDRVATLTPDDILIRPNLEEFGGMDFDSTLDVIEPGESAAREVQPALAMLSMDPENYRVYVRARLARPGSPEQTIRAININNRSSISTESIRSRLGFEVGDVVDQNEIEQGIAHVYGLELFERIDYRIVPGESGTDVMVDTYPRPWGPNYLQFGLELSEDFSQGSNFNIGIAYLQTEVNSMGGEWRAQFDFGERQGFSLDWYQPVSYRSQYFVEAEALIGRRNFRFFEQGEAQADVRIDGWGGTLSAGTEIGRYGEFRLGWSRYTGNAKVSVGTLDIPDPSVEAGEFFTALTYDRMDNPNFPRHGAAATVSGHFSRSAAGADADFEQISGSLFAVRSFGDNSILARLEGGTTLNDDAPLQSQFLLGGLGRLSGYPANRFAGQHFGVASLTAYRRLNRNLWLPVYAGFSLEAGNAWDTRDLVDIDDLRFAGAAYAGADTPLGPLYLAFGLAEHGENTIYLYLGNPFVSEGARPLD